MRITILLFLMAVLAGGCGSKPSSPTTPGVAASPAAGYPVTTFAFTSDAEDFVGRGRSMTFTLENAQFAANVLGDGQYLSIVIRTNGVPTTSWGFIVTSPNGSRIAPGTYTTTGAPVSSSWSADFSGDGRGCPHRTGRMVVHSFDFIPENQALKNFRASFEQHCEGAAAALRGEVAILADPWR